jgi:hypothetical protein
LFFLGVSPLHSCRLWHCRYMAQTDHMPKKNFRVPADLWQAAMEKAAERDETVSDILRAALESFTACDACGTC